MKHITIISRDEAYMEGFEGFNIMKITDMRIFLQSPTIWDIEGIVEEAYAAEQKRKTEKENRKRKPKTEKENRELFFNVGSYYMDDIMEAYNEYKGYI